MATDLEDEASDATDQQPGLGNIGQEGLGLELSTPAIAPAS